MKSFHMLFWLLAPLVTNAQDTTTKHQYLPQYDISTTGGVQYNKGQGSLIYGIEFSLQCPLVTSGKHKIRQQFSLVRQQGKKQKSISLYMNPQYKIFSNRLFEFAAGPAAGLIFSNESASDKPIFTYGAGAGVLYYQHRFFIGVGSRYTLSKKILLANPDVKSQPHSRQDFNNLQTFVRIGYKL